jgi:hypothetical protein
VPDHRLRDYLFIDRGVLEFCLTRRAEELDVDDFSLKTTCMEERQVRQLIVVTVSENMQRSYIVSLFGPKIIKTPSFLSKYPNGERR